LKSLGGGKTVVDAIDSTTSSINTAIKLRLHQLPNPVPPTLGVTGFGEIRWCAEAVPAEVCDI
jgi:hypothetical protein